MTDYVKASEIRPWKREHIEQMPNVCGVYVLRRDTPIDSVQYIGRAGAGRLRDRLLEHHRQEDITEVRYFDWYQTASEDDAISLESEWIDKYNPPQNRREGG